MTAKQLVLAIYPTAYCEKNDTDERYIVFYPLGHANDYFEDCGWGITVDAAWENAAKHFNLT